MVTKVLLKRMRNNTVKSILFSVILFYPSLEILEYLYDIIVVGDYVGIPNHMFYLTCNTILSGHMFQSLLLWFMPIYCLILAADDCIEDYITGYKNILVSKCGKKKYVQSHLIKSFVITFGMLFVALMINLILVNIVFRGGQNNIYDTYQALEILPGGEFITWELKHPLLNNIVFSLITSFFCGLISMVGTISALMIHNKKIVYGITLVMWFVPFLQKNSLMLLFQPNSEYMLNTLVPIGLSVGLVYLIYIFLGYCREVYFEKDNI